MPFFLASTTIYKKKKKMTTWAMRIGYLGAETCSCANTLFSGVENKGQYAVFPISPR